MSERFSFPTSLNIFLLLLSFSSSVFAQSLQIHISPVPGKRTWKVTYESVRPMSGLEFSRKTNKFRASLLKPEQKGVSIIEDGRAERVVLKKPLKQISFEFEELTKNLPKDYEFFKTFTDKSVVMYTGHLDVCVNTDCDERPEYYFTPRKSESLIVGGKVHISTTKWIDNEQQRGTYVYFGKIKPTQTKHVTFITDPGLPNWVSDKITELLSKIFSYYTKQTGHELNFQPFIFVNYVAENDFAGRTGGTLPGQVALSIQGKGWKEADPEKLAGLTHFLGHESAHLWNSQMFPADSKTMWMHEGGAEIFTFKAMRDLGLASQKEYQELHDNSLNECFTAIKQRPLYEVTEDPSFRPFYRCGAIFHLMTEGAVRAKDSSADRFTFWKALFDHAKASGKPYTEEDYFTVLDKLSGDKKTSETIRKLLRDKTIDHKALYLSELKRLGFLVQEATPQTIPKSAQLLMARDLLREIMKKDCGTHALQVDGNGIQVMSEGHCSSLKGDPLITGIQGKKMDQAYLGVESAKKQCQKPKAFIELENFGGRKFKAPCPESFPEKRPYFVFDKLI